MGADELGEVHEQPDGSALVDLDQDAPAATNGEDFYENLADSLDESVLSTLAMQLLEDVDRDKEARKRRDEQYAEGIKRTGLGNEAPGGASFAGASKAVHPVLVEGCVDFAARAIKEIFPAAGPVKTRIHGKQNRAKLQKAQRKSDYMNWQCTTQIKEYRRELEVLLTQLPLGGGQYLKVWFDSRWERIRTEFVPIDDLLLPFEATSLASSPRKTHVQRLVRSQMDERVESGLYRELPLGDAVVTPERTASAEAAGTAEGIDDIGYNEDGLRTVYEQQVTLTLPKGSDTLAKREQMPYILTVDEPSGKVLALRRNWDEEDQDKAEALSWIVEFPFIPWRGAYPIGLAHIIGSLTGAATGALRALLDSAHINNMPGGLRLGGARTTGQDITIEPTQLTQIDAGPGVDDIRKLAMPLPFNPPSAVLFQLLGWITDQAKGVVGTADEKIGGATNQMPVGTALALIEQGSITFSSIHARLHAAQKEVLSIMHRLNARHLSDNEVVEDLGELVVSNRDFQGPMDIEPVSDPNIFSDAQRYAQLQAVLQLSASAPQLYKQDELHKRALALLKVPAPETLLSVPADPEEIDALEENVAATDPLKSVKAYEGQDHMMHLKLHLPFMTSPMFGMNPMLSMPALPALLAHCREHIIMLYKEETTAAHAAQEILYKAQGRIAGSEADAVSLAEQELAKQLGQFMPLLQQVQQKVQQLTQQNAAPDPRIAAAQMKQQTDQAKLAQDAQIASQTQQLEQAKMAADAQARAQDAQLEQMKLMLEQKSVQAEQQLDQIRIQLEQRARESADALERWQTQVEMLTAQRNADIAAEQENSQRNTNTMIEQLRLEQENRRAHETTQNQMIMGLLSYLQAAKNKEDGVVTEQEKEITNTATEAVLETVRGMISAQQKPRAWRVVRDEQGNFARLEQQE
jgi:acetolactate synthase small subunit